MFGTVSWSSGILLADLIVGECFVSLGLVLVFIPLLKASHLQISNCVNSKS